MLFINHLLIIFSLLFMQNISAYEKISIGWIEPVLIGSGNMILAAKIDTGADSSSITSNDLHLYEKNGSKWIKFHIYDISGNRRVIDQPVIKFVKIKRKGIISQRRPVIKLGLCLGNRYRKVYVNVTRRKGFKYKMLVGRNYLSGLYVVDSEFKNTTKPDCEMMIDK